MKYHLVRGVKPVFVIPHEKERENVEDAVGYDASIVFITTPGQVCSSVIFVLSMTNEPVYI